MPGIIDNHTHYDAQVTWDPALRPSPALGVTTAIIGNCGFTIAPCRPADRERIMRNLTQVEGMSLDVLRQGIRWDFETIPEYLGQLERSGAAINLAAFAGHSSIRTWVMGEAATQRAATDEEIARMRAILIEAMQAGAIGFATSTSPAHNGEAGVPMPSRLADDRELRVLVEALAEAGRGVFMLTKGGHTRIDFLEELAAASGRPVVIAALLHNRTNPDAVFADLEAIAQANARGRPLHGAVSCCPLTMDFTLHSPYPVEGLQSWKPALGLKGDAFKAMLARPEFRDAIRAELAAPATFRLFNGEWSQVQVVEVRDAVNAPLEQRTIADLAAQSGRDPLDVMFDLALSEDLDTVFTATLLNSDEPAVARMLNHPNSLVSLSDAGAHLTFFNDAAFGLHLMGHWSRDFGAMSLARAVQCLTGQPAAVYGLRDRGVLRPGAAAALAGCTALREACLQGMAGSEEAVPALAATPCLRRLHLGMAAWSDREGLMPLAEAEALASGEEAASTTRTAVLELASSPARLHWAAVKLLPETQVASAGKAASTDGAEGLTTAQR
jgi:N-acyl-D-aspartate/D-glutamate deacylase